MFERARKALNRRKKQQNRTLPKQLQASDFPSEILIDMRDNHDGTFSISPAPAQFQPYGILLEHADTDNGNQPYTFTVVDFKPSNEAPHLPKELWGMPSKYGRTETGDDVLRHNQEEFRGAKQVAIDEAGWLDEQGVDFTRWELTLTPDREHIASASIYLHDPSTVAELVYDATQKYLPGCAGNYIRYRDPRGVIDDADPTFAAYAPTLGYIGDGETSYLRDGNNEHSCDYSVYVKPEAVPTPSATPTPVETPAPTPTPSEVPPVPVVTPTPTEVPTPAPKTEEPTPEPSVTPSVTPSETPKTEEPPATVTPTPEATTPAVTPSVTPVPDVTKPAEPGKPVEAKTGHDEGSAVNVGLIAGISAAVLVGLAAVAYGYTKRKSE